MLTYQRVMTRLRIVLLAIALGAVRTEAARLQPVRPLLLPPAVIQTSAVIGADGDMALAAWFEKPSGIMARRVTPEGSPEGPLIALAASHDFSEWSDGARISIVGTGTGWAVAWADLRGTMLRFVSRDGSLSSTVMVDPGPSCSGPILRVSGERLAVIHSGCPDIRVAFLDQSGNLVAQMSLGTSEQLNEGFAMAGDGSGFLVVMATGLTGSLPRPCRLDAYRFSRDGNLLRTFPLGTTDDDPTSIDMVDDGAQDILMWIENHKIHALGIPRDTDAPVPLTEFSDGRYPIGLSLASGPWGTWLLTRDYEAARWRGVQLIAGIPQGDGIDVPNSSKYSASAAVTTASLLMVTTASTADAHSARVGVASISDAGGTPLVPLSPTEALQRAISTAANASVRVAVWEENFGAEQSIVAGGIDAGGAMLPRSGLALSEPDEASSNPAIAVGGGGFLVAWIERATDGALHVVGRRISNELQPLDTKPFTIASLRDVFGATVSLTWSGSGWLAVIQDSHPTVNYPEASLTAVRITAAGVPLDPVPLRVSPPPDDATAFDVAWDGGSWFIVWLHYFPGRFIASSCIAATRLHPDGAIFQLGNLTPTATDSRALPTGNSYSRPQVESGTKKLLVTWWNAGSIHGVLLEPSRDATPTANRRRAVGRPLAPFDTRLSGFFGYTLRWTDGRFTLFGSTAGSAWHAVNVSEDATIEGGGDLPVAVSDVVVFHGAPTLLAYEDRAGYHGFSWLLEDE